VWSGKVADDEIIMRRSAPALWIARWMARRTHASLDPTRVGYVVLKDGKEVEHVEPKLKAPLRKGRTASHLTG
jgi:hypothetical protein